MKIIPAIDIIDGSCVRLTQGDYTQKKIYNENPLEIARSFEEAGIRYLHLVDLDGAKAGRVTNWDVVHSLTEATSLSIDFGGGIKTRDEIRRLLDLGVKKVNLGSIAVKNRKLVEAWLNEFGAEYIILSADVKNESIAINGWQENASIPIDQFLEDYLQSGIRHVTCTDISTDGMLTGPNVELYKRLLRDHPGLELTASGGVGSIDDLHTLAATGVDGVIVGKAIYEGRITLNQIRDFPGTSGTRIET
jgi:phosphoribosylformimino-5-aminoimidazole carboxamide ribotide isomerase